jgi:uncharacterized cupin superfamily protein
VSSANSDGVFEPFKLDDVPVEEWPLQGGGVSRFQRVGKHGGGSHVGVNIDELEPGRFSNHFHYHLAEEEHILILQGSATLILGEKSYVLGEGSYCCFPAGQKAGHHLFNHTSSLCRFMTIGENKPDDTCVYPKLGTALSKRTGQAVPVPD